MPSLQFSCVLHTNLTNYIGWENSSGDFVEREGLSIYSIRHFFQHIFYYWLKFKWVSFLGPNRLKEIGGEMVQFCTFLVLNPNRTELVRVGSDRVIRFNNKI